MTNLSVITSEDLGTQFLQNGERIAEVVGPRDGVDPKITAKLQEMGWPMHLIEFDGVCVLPRQSQNYPNPTLNHYALALHLRQSGEKPKKVVDLGCGVGFLGNHAGIHLGSEEIVFADLNPGAVQQSLAAYGINHEVDMGQFGVESHPFGGRIKTFKHQLDGRIGDAAQTLRDYDCEGEIAVAAPFYLPGICEVFPQVYSLFAGVARGIGARLFVGHSNLVNGLVRQAAEGNGLRLSSRAVKTVPFMVDYVGGHARGTSVEQLVDLGLKVDGNSAYHELVVSEMH